MMITPIPGFEGYGVTRNGAVWSYKTKRWLRSTQGTRGRLQVQLWVDGRRWTRGVHKLVAITYLGPCPEGMEIRHLNGNHLDNRAENLKYGTRSENAYDKVRHGVHPMASKTHCKNGHEFSHNDGTQRRCRTCRAAAQRRYMARKRGGG